MRRRDWRLAVLAGHVLLQGCVAAAPPLPAPALISAALPAEGPVCRAGPDGGPPRDQQADRGIGGTGAPPLLLADKGIGGTGIVGLITGFASICVAGREVGYGPGLPVSEDGRSVGPAGLRAGQVAAVEADGALTARRVAIRHEVVGPVQGLEAGLFRIAGQRVAVTGHTLGVVPRPGGWVAVSGFRDGDGVIQATRIDAVRPGGAGAEGFGTSGVLVRGIVQREGGTVRIGTIEIRTAPGIRLRDGEAVVATGRWADGVLLADSVEPEQAPGAYFGPVVGVVVVESFAGFNEGRLVLSRSQGGPSGETTRRSVVELERRPDGTLRPALVRDLAAPARPGQAGLGPGGAVARSPGQPGRGLEPAPVPNRAADGSRAGTDGSRRGNGSNRQGDAGRRRPSGADAAPGGDPGPGGPGRGH